MRIVKGLTPQEKVIIFMMLRTDGSKGKIAQGRGDVLLNTIEKLDPQEDENRPGFTNFEETIDDIQLTETDVSNINTCYKSMLWETTDDLKNAKILMKKLNSLEFIPEEGEDKKE